MHNIHVFLLDVQGVRATDNEMNLKMQLLSLLISDVAVFYSQKDLHDVMNKELTFLIDIERKLHFDVLDA